MLLGGGSALFADYATPVASESMIMKWNIIADTTKLKVLFQAMTAY